MTRTKETARKPVCPICRGYTKSKDFIAHVRQCQENHSCTKCNKTFKKTSYLKKHMSRVHAEVRTFTEIIPIDKTQKTPGPITKDKPLEKNTSEKRSTSTCTSTSKDESSDSEYDFTDYAPDIEIGEDSDENLERHSESEDERIAKPEHDKPVLTIPDEEASEVRSNDQEENKMSEEKTPKDNRIIQDIRTGRIYRKQTRPSSILTPKRKVDDSIKNAQLKILKTRKTQTEEMSNVSLRSIETQTEDTEIAREQLKNKAEDRSEFKNECCYCQICFKDSVLLNLHMGIHTVNDPFKCNRCGLSTSGRFEFYSHIIWGHGN